MFWRKKRKLTSDDYHIEVNINPEAPDGSDFIKVEFQEADRETLRKLKARDDKRVANFVLPSSIPSTDELRHDIILKSNSPFFPSLDAKTTQKVREALDSSMGAGEPLNLLKERLSKILTDKKMVEDIAYTESVYAYSAATVRYGELSKAVGKEWQAVPGCCADCAALNDKKVPVGLKFSQKDRLGHPPLHQQCCCGVRLMYFNEKSKLSQTS